MAVIYIFLIKYHKQNHGYKYILACIDTFTRKANAIPLKLKDDENVSEGIKEIINKHIKPLIL